jgi:hypothetical protein
MVWVAAAATASAGSGANVCPSVSGIRKLEKPSASARRALAIHSSAERAWAATTPKRKERFD